MKLYMNSKRFYAIHILMLMLTAFAVVSGGCGGSSSSSSSSGTAETVIINDELADDETPDILEFGDVASKSYTSLNSLNNSSISVPSRTRIARLMPVKSADTFIAELTRGTEYTVEISKGEYYTEPIGHNIPDVEIINPAGDALGFADDTGLDDTVELSVYPKDEPYMICLTFRPSVSGEYKINLCQSVSNDAVPDDVTVFVYREFRSDETGEAGYYKRFKFQDKDGNLSDTISMSDVMALRKAFNDAAKSIIEGWTVSDDEETAADDELNGIIEAETNQAQAYLDCVRMIKQYYGIFDDYKELEKYKDINSYDIEMLDALDADENETAEVRTAVNNSATKVPAELYGIPYEWKFHLGEGFYAISGRESRYNAVRYRAIKLTAPAKKYVKSLFKAGFVSSQEDAERFAATTVNGSVQLGGFGFDTVYSGSNSLKFGLTSTTFLIHYEETEPQYRMLDDDEEYQLTPYAKNVLSQNGSWYFRYIFGDYFVGGYQYGTTFDAFVTITTNTIEQFDRVKARLPELFKSEKDVESADIINRAKEFLNQNEATVRVEIRTAGVNVRGYSSNDFNAIASSLTEFRTKSKALKPASLQPVHVVLKRFRLLPDVFNKMREEGDGGLIPISSEHAKKVMAFKKDMVTMHAYRNTILDINNLNNKSLRDGYITRYMAIRTVNDSFFEEENAEKLQKRHDDMLNLINDMKDLADRHVFYRLLMAEQAKERNPSGSVLDRPYGAGGGTIGYQSFMSSKAVQSDINEGRDIMDEKNTFSGSEWEPKFDAGDGYVFCHIKVTANNIHDRERKAVPPNIGHRTADFFFKCGRSRWLEWKIELKSMRLNSKLYPFTGLR